MSAPALVLPSLPDDAVVCDCGHVIYDGEVIRSRCVKPRDGTALCRCKRWVRLSDKESRVDNQSVIP